MALQPLSPPLWLLHRGFIYSVEERMIYTSFCRQSFIAVYCKDPSHEVNGSRGHLSAADLAFVLRFEPNYAVLFNLRELDACVKITRQERFPVLLCQRAEDCLDDEELVNVTLPGEQRGAIKQLSHDAPDRPDIDLVAVVRQPEEQLRRAVPASRHIIGQLSGSSVHRQHSREPEVA